MRHAMRHPVLCAHGGGIDIVSNQTLVCMATTMAAFTQRFAALE